MKLMSAAVAVVDAATFAADSGVIERAAWPGAPGWMMAGPRLCVAPHEAPSRTATTGTRTRGLTGESRGSVYGGGFASRILRYTCPFLTKPMRTILVVDDSPTIRKMVRAALGSLTDVGFIEASSGLQAIETLAIHPVRMIVLDLNMPDMHGLDVLRFLRSHSRYRNLPVMVLTTRGDDTSRQAVLEAGASSYLTKPFSPSFLVSSVRQLLEPEPNQPAP